MNATTHVVQTSAEAQAQLAHSNVLAQRRLPERAKRAQPGEQSQATAAGSVYASNAYMLLISRIENMVRRKEIDPSTLDQLRSHIAQHLTVLPERSRQTIQGLEGYGQLGAETFAGLPNTLVRALRNSDKAGPALEFLKQPAFVAYMRNEPKNRLYSAQGILRAS